MTLHLGNRGLSSPAWTDGAIRLYVHDSLSLIMGSKTVATWGSERTALIDGPAYDILRTVCGDNLQRLERYLQAIARFEIRHSDSVQRHERRTRTELEILRVLRENGYFN